MGQEELIAQSMCFQWFHNKYIGKRKLLHCNMNNSVNSIAGNKAKAVGVVAGVSDLELIHQGTVIFIELKIGNNTMSEEQKEFAKAITEEGLSYILFNGKDRHELLDKFKNFITGLYEA